jgi:hypothetical protein
MVAFSPAVSSGARLNRITPFENVNSNATPPVGRRSLTYPHDRPVRDWVIATRYCSSLW